MNKNESKYFKTAEKMHEALITEWVKEGCVQSKEDVIAVIQNV